MSMRIGLGFDSHAFKPGVPLVIGGLKIDHPEGLAGHSDGDLLLHAITDALLGAVSAGDIGTFFPPIDPKWKNADSTRFVNEAVRIVNEMEADIANVDITIIAQKPKIAPFREAIGAKIAELLNLPRGHVNVKATTTDQLGFIGRGEGICAMAVVLISTK